MADRLLFSWVAVMMILIVTGMLVIDHDRIHRAIQRLAGLLTIAALGYWLWSIWH